MADIFATGTQPEFLKREEVLPEEDKFETSFTDALQASAVLTINGMSNFLGDEYKRPYQREEGYSILNDEPQRLLKESKITPEQYNDFGLYEAQSTADLTAMIERNNLRRESLAMLQEDYPIAQYPLMVATSFVNPLDVALMPFGYKALGTIKMLNDMSRLDNTARVGLATGLSATTSEYLLQREYNSYNPEEIADTALISSAFGMGLGSLLPVNASVRPEVHGKSQDELMSRNYTNGDVENITDDFSHITDAQAGKDRSWLKGLVISPISKLNKSNNPSARYIAQRLESSARALYDGDGNLFTSPKNAMTYKYNLVGINNKAQATIQQQFATAKQANPNLKLEEYTQELGNKYRDRLNNIEQEAWVELDNLDEATKRSIYQEAIGSDVSPMKKFEDKRNRRIEKTTKDSDILKRNLETVVKTDVGKETNKLLAKYEKTRKAKLQTATKQLERESITLTKQIEKDTRFLNRKHLKSVEPQVERAKQRIEDNRSRIQSLNSKVKELEEVSILSKEDVEGITERVEKKLGASFRRIELEKQKKLKEIQKEFDKDTLNIFDDLDDVVAGKIADDIEARTPISDELKVVRSFYNEHQLKAQEVDLSGIRNKNGNRFMNRVWLKDKIADLGVDAFTERMVKAMDNHPATKRAIIEAQSRGDDLAKIENEMRETARHMFSNIQHNSILKELEYKELSKPPKGTSSQLQRKIRVDERLVKDLLEADTTSLMSAYSFKTSGKISVKKFLGVESTEEVGELLKRIEDEGLAQGQSVKEVAKDRDNLEILIKSVWGSREIADRPNIWSQKASRFAKKFNYITLGGGFGLNTLTELGTLVSTNGVKALKQLVPSLGEAVKMYRKQPNDEWVNELLSMGLAGDIWLSNRVHRFDQMDFFHSGKVEGILDKGMNFMSNASGLNFMTTALELTAGSSSLNDLLTQANKIKAGKTLSTAELKRLARLGLTKDDVARLAETHRAKYNDKGYITSFNWDNWTDRELAEKIRDGVQESIKNAVIQADATTLPAFMTDANSPVAQVVTQFLRFPIAAHERLLLKGLDEISARQVTGFMMSMGVIAMLNVLREEAMVRAGMIKENERKFDLDKEEGLENLGRAIWNKAPHLGMTQPIVDTLLSVSGQQPIGDDFGGARSLASLSGVTLSRVEQGMKFAKDIKDGDLGASSMYFGKSLVPFQNLPLLDTAFKEVIKDLND